MKVGIFGRTKANNSTIIQKAREIGKIIAVSNHIVVTGGTSGYPDIVAMSAIQGGGKAISYVTGMSMSDHYKFHDADLSKYTDVVFQKKYFSKKLLGIDNYLRSLDMCSNVGKAIIIGGRVGTMYEVTILSGMSKDMFVLKGSGGITGQTINNFIEEGHKEESKIIFFENPGELNELLEK